jgi:fatty-acyl-CoA synthase
MTLSVIHGPPLDEEIGLGPLTLGGYLREVTTRYAEREALVMHYPDGSVVRWSYAELWEKSMAVARALLASGLGKDGRVGVMMTNRPEWLAAFFGASLAGGLVVTLSTFSTPAELEHLLQVSGVEVLLFEGTVLKKDFAAILRDLEPAMMQPPAGDLVSLKFPYLRRIAVVGAGAGGAVEAWETYLARGSDVSTAQVLARAEAVKPAEPGALFYSSGSTGKAKGILNTHRGITIQCWRWRRMLQLGDDVRCWSANGFFWSGNFCMALGSTLTSGGSLVLQATFIPDQALQLMQDEKVTLVFAWPHQQAQLAAAANWDRVDLSSLHYADLRTALGTHKSVTTDWYEPLEAYGNTETFTLTTCFPSGTPRHISEGSHGVALPGNTIKIVDPLTGATLPQGERGEIAVKGPTLMIGYVGIPYEDTFDREGFFCTSDGGYIDDRLRLVWEGRLNDIVKTGGANVSPLEVDAVLETHPGVRISRAVGVPHETLGEMLVACIVAHEGAALTENAVRDFAKTYLASYKVPRRVLFVREDELKLTGSAKVKLGDLRELATKRLEAERS